MPPKTIPARSRRAGNKKQMLSDYFYAYMQVFSSSVTHLTFSSISNAGVNQLLGKTINKEHYNDD